VASNICRALVHGSSTTSFVFRGLFDALAARGVYAVGFDLPGHGLSAARGEPLPTPTDSVMASYVSALADALQLAPHHLVVMEDAAGIGVEYAALHGRTGGALLLTAFATSSSFNTFAHIHHPEPYMTGHA